MNDCQIQVKDVTTPLYNKYQQLIGDCVSVPYVLAQTDEIPTSESTDNLVSAEELEDNGVVDDAFERNCNIASDQIKAAIYKTDKEIDKLLEPEANSTEKPPTNISTAEDEDEMDSLFDSDNESNGGEADSCELNSDSENMKPDNRLIGSLNETNQQTLAELESLSATFTGQLNDVTKLIHEAMHTLRTLIMLAYDSLNCTEGYDIASSVIQECLFANIADHIHFLFR